MLVPITRLLAGRRMILASASSRRKQILENVKFPFDVVPSRFEENLDKSKFHEPWQYAVENSKQKALEVARRLQDEQDWAVVAGADTIVVLDSAILEKPGTPEKAYQMLRVLSGKTHLVYTGMTLVYRDGEKLQEHCFYETTYVTFAPLTEEIIQSYVESGETLDKAGGYGIQGLGGTLVMGINGDYFNVVGLPLHRLCTELIMVLKRQLNTN